MKHLCGIDFVIHEIPHRLEEDPVTGWHKRILYSGPTGLLDELCVHTGVLSGHTTPHPPHCHDHEEIHIALSDTFEHVSLDAASGHEFASPVNRGSILFTDSEVPHTFRNSGNDPAAYFHARWRHVTTIDNGKPGLQFFDRGDRLNTIHEEASGENSEGIEIYSGPTRYLSLLTVRFHTLQKGCAVPLHRHHHELLLALVSGSVEVLGKKIDAPGFAFLRTLVPHGLCNHGSAPAGFYAIEFHRQENLPGNCTEQR